MLRMVGCDEIKQALYADEAVLVAETREHLQHERACDSIGLKMNVGRVKC